MKIVKPGFEILTDVKLGIDILKRIEAAGRTCYKSEDKITGDSCFAFARMILKRGHESVLEHESISVRFICDRGVSHELVRHRLAAYSQESTRYCDYSGGEVAFIEPVFWKESDPVMYSTWLKAMSAAEEYYLMLRRARAKPEEARSVLPNSLKTEIVMTANLREWRHVFRLRTAKAAHPQMREIMRPLLLTMRSLIPVVFDDVGEVE
jgi:thymidylate synthase (FAD)